MKIVAPLAVLAALALPSTASAAACHPTPGHPEPVVLVHGTFGDSTNWAIDAPQLRAAGYCTFAIDYGNRGTGEIARSAQQLKTFVDGVLAQTGASRVDIIGHSQGGMMPRYYIKNLGGAAKVDDLVGFAPSNHGTTTPLAPYAVGCPACMEQAFGSPFITALNAGGDTVPGVKYTVIQSRYDEVVTPYTSAFLTGANVTNITLQSQCILDFGDHLSMPFDHIAARDVLNALDPANARTPLCTPIVAAVGG
jgi:triacylglycerol esterase/lipase EstA (alpha/beta hydrolase family)